MAKPRTSRTAARAQERPPNDSRPPLTELEGLYRQHARDVYRFALFLSGDAALAEDIVSETFVRLWHARARVDLTTVRAYLFAIARNLFLQDRRRRRPAVLLDDEAADVRPGPEVRALARSELQAVLAALQTLPEIDRAAVSMRAEDALPYEEIARALNIPVATARVKVHRARLALAAARSASKESKPCK